MAPRRRRSLRKMPRVNYSEGRFAKTRRYQCALTDYRKNLIAEFLKMYVECPTKFGYYGSHSWISELLKLFKRNSAGKGIYPRTIMTWMETSDFFKKTVLKLKYRLMESVHSSPNPNDEQEGQRVTRSRELRESYGIQSSPTVVMEKLPGKRVTRSRELRESYGIHSSPTVVMEKLPGQRVTRTRELRESYGIHSIPIVVMEKLPEYKIPRIDSVLKEAPILRKDKTLEEVQSLHKNKLGKSMGSHKIFHMSRKSYNPEQRHRMTLRRRNRSE